MRPDVPVRYLGERKHENAARLWSAASAHPGVLALQPLSLLYSATVRARRAAYDRGLAHSVRVGVPVISVGNLTVGGSGKTPVAGWVIDQLRRMGHTPALLHSGYADDEPQLHRMWRPNLQVIAGKDRVASARSAIAAGATVLVLDDGFQHLRLARDLDIVLIPADSWSQPKRMLPAGPWREPLSTLRRGGVIVITRKAADRAQAAECACASRLLCPAFRSRSRTLPSPLSCTTARASECKGRRWRSAESEIRARSRVTSSARAFKSRKSSPFPIITNTPALTWTSSARRQWAVPW